MQGMRIKSHKNSSHGSSAYRSPSAGNYASHVNFWEAIRPVKPVAQAPVKAKKAPIEKSVAGKKRR